MATIKLEPQQTSGGGGTTKFDLLEERPMYAGEEMTHLTDIPDVSATLNAVDGRIVEPII